MALMGIDVGTSQIKVGLFDLNGEAIRLAGIPTPTQAGKDGHLQYDPETLWLSTLSAIRELLALSHDVPVEAIGVASMAEAGLLVDRASGEARSAILPWFDSRPSKQAAFIALQDSPKALFQRSGLRPSYKFGLSKLLWLRDSNPEALSSAIWLSVADFIVFRMTGSMATDPTLAARTYLFNIAEGTWDRVWIEHFTLDAALFPEVVPSGTPVGKVTADVAAQSGLDRSIPVAVAGHDHICALLAMGIVHPGPVLDSIGTAESVMGVLDSLCLDDRAFESELSIVPHVVGDTFCWLGGLPAAGASIEWIRAQLATEPIPYEAMASLVGELPAEPTGLLYFPYLLGSGAPYHNGNVRAAFIGLSGSHSRAHILKAVLEGTAFATEAIRRAAEILDDRPIDSFIAVGGGTRNRLWMQIRADVTGCAHRVPAEAEATALGAALSAGLGSGIVWGIHAIAGIARYTGEDCEIVIPSVDRHRAYRALYEEGYIPVGSSLRRHSDVGTAGMEMLRA
ncbi:MAG: xylulokinase [Chloroflexota bacterium]